MGFLFVSCGNSGHRRDLPPGSELYSAISVN